MPERSRHSQLKTRSRFPRVRVAVRTFAPAAAMLLVFFFTAWFALSWFQSVQRIVRCYTPLPASDYWRTAAFLHSYQTFDLSVLWRQHNDHRIVFPEIVFATDLLLLHGRAVLPLALSFLCYFGNWLVLAWAFWSVPSLSASLRAAGVLLSGIVIGWQGSATVLAAPFLLQWTLTQIAVLLSLAFLVRLKETAYNLHLACAIVCAVVATYSSSSGLTLWPLLVAAALLLSIGRKQLAILTAAGVLSIGIYFFGYKFSGELSIGNLVKHPIYLVEFVASYMSMPLGAMKSYQFGTCLGVVALTIAAVLAVLAFRTRLLSSRAGIVLFGTYAFFCLTALLTAAGRMNPKDPGFADAKAARYVSGPLVAWAALILMCVWFSSRWRKAAGWVTAIILALLLAAGLPKLRWWIAGEQAQFVNTQLAALAMELDIYDPTTTLGIFPDPPSAQLWAGSLRQNHLSVFYEPHSKWLGRPATQFAPFVNDTLPAGVSCVLPVREGVEVTGWFDTSKARRPPPAWVLFTNENGQIVGFGRKLPAGFPDALDNPHTPPSIGWAGFINERYPVKAFSTYVIDKRGLVPIEGSTTVPHEHIVGWEDAGSRITGIRWQMDPSWTVDNLQPHTPFGHAPPGPIYGSWSGDDANTGRLTSSGFPAPPDDCLILPVLQGPRPGGLSADVLDAATNQVVAHAWFNNAPNAWRFWRFDLPAGTKQLRITAEDRGKDWGEWLAVANPSNCK